MMTDQEMRAAQRESDRKTQQALYLQYFVIVPSMFLGLAVVIFAVLYVFVSGLINIFS